MSGGGPRGRPCFIRIILPGDGELLIETRPVIVADSGRLTDALPTERQRRGGVQYATRVQLGLEERLVTQAGAGTRRA